MSKVTYVLPVYNGEKTLKKCIESVLNQNYEDVELLVINNGSTDNSQRVIQQFEYHEFTAHVSVRYLYQPHVSMAKIRNLGIELAQGEYIAFLGQTDFLNCNYTKRMMKVASSQRADIVVSGYVQVNDQGSMISKKTLRNNTWAPYEVMAPWGHFYRKEFLERKELQFAQFGPGEDIYFNMLAYQCARKISVSAQEGYCWTHNEKEMFDMTQSGIGRRYNPFPMLNHLEQEMHRRNLPYTEEREYYMLRFVTWYSLHSLRGGKWSDVLRTNYKLFRWLEVYYPDYQKNKNIIWSLPLGEKFAHRLIVWIFIRLHMIGLDRMLLRVCSLFTGNGNKRG